MRLPAGAPVVYPWHVKRGEVIARVCERLGVTRTSGRASPEPLLVGLAGPPGSGKSIAASMVIAREDVRACFLKGVLWLSVGAGAGAKDRLPVLMYRLADMVYETVLGLEGRPPRTPDVGVDPENGATYIREAMGFDIRRLLIVADDVCEEKVLGELRSTGASLLYTTRSEHLFSDPSLVRLGNLRRHEAETVLRRVTEVDDEAALPKAAYEVIERCGSCVVELVFVGRWGAIRERVDREAWQKPVDRIIEAQRVAERQTARPIRWRTALLRAGLDELVCLSEQTRTLYFSLSVIPKGVDFRLEDAAALLHDGDCSLEELEEVSQTMTVLELMAIVARQMGGLYRIHDLHAEFTREAVADRPTTRDTAQARWLKHISTAKALFAWPLDALVDIWRSVDRSCDGVEARIGSPYDMALQALNTSDPRLPKVLRRVAYFHWLVGDRDGACAKWVKLVATEGEGGFQVGFPNLDRTLYHLGLHQENAGRISEAEAWFRQALRLQEERPETDHLNVSDTLHHLAKLSSIMGQAQDAERLYRRALAIKEATLGTDHPDVASTLSSLASCLLKTGRFEEAKKFLGRALAIYENKLGTDHSQVARTLYDLGRCARSADNGEEAERLYRQALLIQERSRPASLSELGDTLFALGGCVSEAGRIVEANILYQRALNARESILSPRHNEIARTAYALGKCRYELGRTDEAEGLCRRALVIVEENLGGNHPDSADILHTLGACAVDMGRRDGAVDLLYRALEIYKKHLGKDHSKVAHILYDLGRSASKAGLANEAERLFSRALVIKERNLGDDHPEVATILCALGDCASKRGVMEDAEGLYRRALAIQEVSLGANHRDVVDTLHALGKCTLFVGRNAEAAEFYQRTLAILEGQLPTDHVEVSEVQHGLALCQAVPTLSE